MIPGRSLSRRSLIAGAGGFIVALALPRGANAATSADGIIREPPDTTALDAFIRVPRSGPITFVMPSAEIGQGIFTAHAQILAEELDVALADVRVVAAPTNPKLYANPLLHDQQTGASDGVRGFYMPLRVAAAGARQRLISAAEKRWHVEPGSCVAQMGTVVHRATGRTLRYGQLADAAAREPNPPRRDIRLKSAAAFRVIGTSPRRVDTPAKADGSATFGIDVVRPGMKIATMLLCPVIGGRLASVDTAPAMAVRGVRHVVSLPNAVAVVADNTWAAMKGAGALDPQWAGGDATLQTSDITDALRQAAESSVKPTYQQASGDVDAALKYRSGILDAVYHAPFLAHAAMEPLNAVVELTEGRCEVWVGTQAPARAQQMVCKITGLAPEQVVVHSLLAGGGFGRRNEADVVVFAVEIAKVVRVPVKLIWTREQEFRAGYFRPAFRHIVKTNLGADNAITGWSYRVVGGDVFALFVPSAKVPDADAIDGATGLPYDVGPMRLEYIRKDPPIPITWWRSIGPGHNMFVVEGVIEELAAKAGMDPLAFRRHVIKDARALRVLNLAAEKGDWGSPLPPRVGRGIALQSAFGSFLACVLEAAVTADGHVGLRRITAAVDCGQAISPDGVRSQIEGGLIFGLSAALWGKIDIADGRIVQSNFNDYRVLRMNEVPPIEVHLVPSLGAPEGIGEAGCAVAFPALASAIHAATGVRLRSMPFDRHDALRQGPGATANVAVPAAIGVGAIAAARLAIGAARRNPPAPSAAP